MPFHRLQVLAEADTLPRASGLLTALRARLGQAPPRHEDEAVARTVEGRHVLELDVRFDGRADRDALLAWLRQQTERMDRFPRFLISSHLCSHGEAASDCASEAAEYAEIAR